jgi:hypothetical protein
MELTAIQDVFEIESLKRVCMYCLKFGILHQNSQGGRLPVTTVSVRTHSRFQFQGTTMIPDIVERGMNSISQ